MNKLKNYLLATGCLVILAGVLTLFSPVVQQGQAVTPPKDVTVVNTSTNPVPVVVQNGDADGNVVITLAENLSIGAQQTIELVSPDVSSFHFVSFLASSSNGDAEFLMEFAWFTESGQFSDPVPRQFGGECAIDDDLPGTAGPFVGVRCGVFRVAGPFLPVSITNTKISANLTLKAFLMK